MLSPRPPGVLPEWTASSPSERTGVSSTGFGGCWEVQTGAWGEEGCFYLSCHLCLHRRQRRVRRAKERPHPQVKEGSRQDHRPLPQEPAVSFCSGDTQPYSSS